MNQRPMTHARTLFAALLIVSACDRPAPPANAHQSLTSLDTLRGAFNTDTGKVRAIFLASPT